MRRFSIQHPATRGYQGEVIFQETLRRLGVLTPRYFFVDVIINGDDIGIMALEEHFEVQFSPDDIADMLNTKLILLTLKEMN